MSPKPSDPVKLSQPRERAEEEIRKALERAGRAKYPEEYAEAVESVVPQIRCLLAEKERLEEALDVLSRWPPGEGMLAMCQFARAALARDKGGGA